MPVVEGRRLIKIISPSNINIIILLVFGTQFLSWHQLLQMHLQSIKSRGPNVLKIRFQSYSDSWIFI